MSARHANTLTWEQLLSATRDDRTRRIAWRLLRQFVEPSACTAEYGTQLKLLWAVSGLPTAPPSPLASNRQDAVKLLLSNDQGVRCETVTLLPGAGATSPNGHRARATACVSSQPGCGVGCPFCATSTLGYRGSLTSLQIIEQVYWSGYVARQLGRRLRNVVFMGMGEPLHNTEAVLEALHWLVSPQGFGLSARHITVSTAGVPSAMLKLASQFPRLRIALSLHSAEPLLRKRLVPRAVSDLLLLHQTITEVNKLQAQPVWLECVLFEGLNDTQDQATQMIEFCRGLNVEVNLIPYNSAANSHLFQASSRLRREAFAGRLRAAGIRTSIRQSFGADSQAACGQLVAK